MFLKIFINFFLFKYFIINIIMIQLLAFDIGTKNMAYCYSIIDDNNNFIINKLNKIDLNVNKYSNIQKIIDNTIDFLEITINNDIIINQNEKLIVLIECQMKSDMKTIQTVINTFFKMIGKYDGYIIETIYLSPKHKLNIINKYSDIIKSSSYKQNKHDSIFFTKYLLENTYKNNQILDFFNNIKKKDDISDAFLMCVYYFETKNNIF